MEDKERSEMVETIQQLTKAVDALTRQVSEVQKDVRWFRERAEQQQRMIQQTAEMASRARGF